MKTLEKLIRVGVVGARGYSGQELCRLLFKHSGVRLDTVFFNEGKSFSLWSQFPELERIAKANGQSEPKGQGLEAFFKAYSKSTNELDLVFLATPNEVSLDIAASFLEKGISVIDLSGVFRLNKVSSSASLEMYLKHYGLEHAKPKLLSSAVYGLQPFASDAIRAMKPPFLVANPGCFVTSALMALIPLLSEGVVDPASIIVDSKSGASGAGKKLNENLLFSELYGDFYPYKVLSHQHVPEMDMYLSFFSQKETSVVFTPHLLPVFRGILSTCYLKWNDSIKAQSTDVKKKSIASAYEKHFRNYPLVDWGEWKDQQRKISLKSIAGSCMTHIGFEMDKDNLIVFSVLDNLLKGAASQAVENLNSIYGFPAKQALE